MELLLLGASLGFAAGVSPGPLLALTVTASLERGFGAGVRVAVAPLVSDAPIVALSLLVLHQLPQGFLRALSIAGGVLLIWLGVQTVRQAGGGDRTAETGRGAAAEVGRAAMVNLLNPSPWLFWAAVGGPLLIEAWRSRPWAGAAFLGGFYLLLVGSKLAIAWGVARGRHRLSEPWYRRLIAGSGALLIVLGALLLLRRAAP